MRYKGLNFRKSRTIIPLRRGEPLMPGFSADPNIYIQFGRLVKQGALRPPQAVETDWVYYGTDEKCWAIPITCAGHSRTNMCYVDDYRGVIAIAMIDGEVYQARVSYKGA